MKLKNGQRLEAIEINPTAPAEKTIIWLHGLGADGSDFVPAVAELGLPEHFNVRFIFPNAPIMPITINNGYTMRAWYDITTLSFSQTDREGINTSIQHIEQLVDYEKERGISSENILLGGFSQGAVIALMTGLQCSQTLGGILALSGYLPLTTNEIASGATGKNKNTPIFMAHGMEDAIVPYALGKAAYAELTNAGYPARWHSYPIGHTVSAPEILEISQWMQKIWEK